VTLQFTQQEASNPPFPLVTTRRSEFALQKSPFQGIFVGYLVYIFLGFEWLQELDVKMNSHSCEQNKADAKS
jgi:hypothetical protein